MAGLIGDKGSVPEHEPMTLIGSTNCTPSISTGSRVPTKVYQLETTDVTFAGRPVKIESDSSAVLGNEVEDEQTSFCRLEAVIL